MTKIIQLNTSINQYRKGNNSEESVVIDAAYLFQQVGKLKEQVNDIIDEGEEYTDGLEKPAQMYCFFYDYANIIKTEFENKYHQEIQNSVFRKAISDSFICHFQRALMYLTDMYATNPDLYNEALIRERLLDFRNDIEKILHKDFSGYRYSKFRLEHAYNNVAFRLITGKK